MSLGKTRFYDFGDLRLDTTEKILLRDGKFIPITPKVFETLQILVENAGHLLEKDELMRKIWQDRFVEESNLTFNIKMLRKALGDSASQPRFIETVPRRGYRFIGEIRENIEENVLEPEFQPKKNVRPEKFRLPLTAFGVVLFCTITVGSWFAQKRFFHSASSAPVLSAPFHSEKLSTSGKVAHAVVSPDGKLTAFVNATGEKSGVWLRRLDTSDNVQLVPPSDDDYLGLSFARDGNWLFFVRKKKEDNAPTAVYRISVLGGIPEKIIDRAEGWISLSPDDRQVSFVRCQYADNDFCSLFIADVNAKTERKILTRPRPVRISDNQFSPDGNSIAFAAGQSWNGGSDFRLLRFDLKTGAESEITSKKFFNITNLKWLPGGDSLLLAAIETLDGKSKIWQVSTAKGEVEPLTKDAASYSAISLNDNADKIIATQVGNNFQLYFYEGGVVKTLTAARDLAFAPDGKIVYAANDGDIWTIRRDGGEQRQLTNNAFKDFMPVVSPANHFIFFASNRTGANQVWRMNTDGGNQFQITQNEGGYPFFVSPDENWVYYRSGVHETLWKVSTAGSDEIQVSNRKMLHPAFSPDGSLIAYFFRENEWKIGVTRIADGKQIKVLDYADGKSTAVSIAWSNDNRTLNFITANDAKNILWSQSLDIDKPLFVADLGDREIEDFKLAPDGSFAITRGEWLHDAVLIDGLK